MSYRGDEDAQRARVDELERRLAAAEAEIATLRGEGAASAAGTTVEHSRLSGGPSRYVREQTLPHGITEAGYEAIAKVLRERLGLNATQVGRTLTVPGAFSLAREGDGTRLRLEADWRSFGHAVVASGGLAGGFGGLVSTGVLADVINHGLGWHHAFAVDAGLTAAVVTLASALAVGSAWGMRRRVSRASREKHAAYEGTFEAIVSLAEAHASPAVPRARVAPDVPEEPEAVDPEAAGVAAQRARVE